MWSWVLFHAIATSAIAGGSGLNIAVVVNQLSSNSVALGNYYCEHRRVPPANLVRIEWTGGNIEWSAADFTNVLLNPLLTALNERGLTNQIDYVLLSMDIPYRVTSAGLGINSTTACLFYGFKPDPRDPFTCPLATNSESSYAGSEAIFRLAPPATATSGSFLAFMLTGATLDEARAVIDRGIAADGTFPTNTVVLQKTSDAARNVRFEEFDNAIFNLRLRDGMSAVRTNSDATADWSGLLGFQTGLEVFSLTNTTFAPGAIADNLTSFGGAIFENGFGQTTLIEFLRAGATGSYGTVVEPCNYPDKFPDPQVFFHQACGFSLAEAYYLSITNPYQGILIGEPLCAPFAQTAQVAWNGVASNAVLSATVPLAVAAVSGSATRPIQRIDLFVDGKFHQTLTNIAPEEGNILNVTIAGRSMNFTVPSGATVESVTTGVAAAINDHPNPNFTEANAFPFGDRIELRAQSAAAPGSAFPTGAGSSQGTAAGLTTFIHAARTNFLDSVAVDSNPNDLKARNHLYVSAGRTNLTVAFPLDTTVLADGFHELTAVAIEGTHVQTQSRATVPVFVQNTALSATLALAGAGPISALETNFTAHVAANATNVSWIELFSTGGRIASATNQSSATFVVPGNVLGAGLHAVHARIATVSGAHFHTTNALVRLVPIEKEIPADITLAPPPRLAWPGAVGRRYSIFSAENPGDTFVFREAIVASNSTQNFWIETNLSSTVTQRFYRIGVSP